MQKKIKNFWDLLKKSFGTFMEVNPYLVGAAIAFYILFAMGPLMAVMVQGFELFLAEKTIYSRLVTEVRLSLGDQAAEMIKELIQQANTPGKKTITTIIAIPMIISGSVVLFYQIRNTLNYMWGINKSGGSDSTKDFINDYAVSFLMVLITGIIFLILILKTPILQMIESKFFSIPRFVLSIIDIVVNLGVSTLLFAFIYRLLPETDIRWSDVWSGAFLTGFLFTAAQYVIGLYLSTTEIGTAYGSLGSLTLMLIWVFYSSMVFIFGAAYTYEYTRKHGSKKNEKI